MSYSEFVRLCEKVEYLSSRVTHQLVNTYPELHRLRKDLDSFQDELVGIIRELPSEEEEEVSREQRRLLNFNIKYFEKMEREFMRVNRLEANSATNPEPLKIVGFLLSESYKDHRKNNLSMSSIKSMPLPSQE